MKVIVIGAGASGIVAAINYKRHQLNDEVLVIEHLEKPLKKLLATGNGKCNLGNSKIDFNKYSDPIFAKKILEKYNYENFFDSISIKTKLLDNLAYPVSESAVSVRDGLLNECKKLGIVINTEEKLIGYKKTNKIDVKTDKNHYVCDKLILAGGLKSSPKLGSDGSVINILFSHGYQINELKPGLSPLITKEKTKIIDGTRVKCLVKLVEDNRVIHEEFGEVLFKEHGLSGIVIFNIMSLISRSSINNHRIVIDLLPDFSVAYLSNYKSTHTFAEFMQAFINPKIASYLKERFLKEDCIFKAIKNLEFTFDKSYGFDFSQVTVGGIAVSQIKENMESKLEDNIYIIGELLDIDGPCGGYNLTWAFGSALRIK